MAINANRVRRLVGQGRHRLMLTLDTGDEFLVGRQFQRATRSRFGFKS
jgi:DNA-binding LytR/AlgR family response regulator